MTARNGRCETCGHKLKRKKCVSTLEETRWLIERLGGVAKVSKLLGFKSQVSVRNWKHGRSRPWLDQMLAMLDATTTPSAVSRVERALCEVFDTASIPAGYRMLIAMTDADGQHLTLTANVEESQMGAFVRLVGSVGQRRAHVGFDPRDVLTNPNAS